MPEDAQCQNEMRTTAELIRLLSDAQRTGRRSVDATALDGLDRPAAYRIMLATQSGLGETTGMLKTAVLADGFGAAAPIYASRVGRSASYAVPADRVLGLEVEVGIVLARDIPVDDHSNEAAIAAAVDHYFVGVEVVGTRYADRSKAGPVVGLADNMSAYGYVIGANYERGTNVDGQMVTIERAGQQIYAAPAKHGFGSVLASVAAYARVQQPGLLLTAGTVITTGSLCGMVLSSGAGHVVARLGDIAIEFDIT